MLNLGLVGVGYIGVFRISHPKFFEIICIFIKIMLDLYCFFLLYLGILEGMWLGSKPNYSSKEVSVKGVEED